MERFASRRTLLLKLSVAALGLAIGFLWTQYRNAGHGIVAGSPTELEEQPGAASVESHPSEEASTELHEVPASDRTPLPQPPLVSQSTPRAVPGPQALEAGPARTEPTPYTLQLLGALTN